MINIVLHEPEIPQNTGNIARTCAATGTALHLIKPLGFSISDKQVKRAGLDYWDQVSVFTHNSWDAFMESCQPEALFCFTTKAQSLYTDVNYTDGCYLVFGKETAGLPGTILSAGTCVRMPMMHRSRSLNLSNTAAVAVYEALRQTGFPGLQLHGKGIPAS